MTNYLRYVWLLLAIVVCSSLQAKVGKGNGLAIVIDPVSKQQAETELNDYIRALEEVQHFNVHLVVDHWGVPDSIRAELKRLYEQKGSLVGTVLIGDIPIVMVRDAQHMASAFKMNQKFPWQDSSIPSDRFYDDFHLSFQFLKKDSIAPYYYYSLTAEGAQHLSPNIFSGRIRPTDAGGTSRYDKLKLYLTKATVAKRHPEPVRSVFVYTGSGSLSESKVAHIDEMRGLLEHFPHLASVPNAFNFIDHSDAPFVKNKIMNELMRPDLSIGLLHHHGDYDTQYFSAYPRPHGSEEAKQYMLYNYRESLRRAKRFGENLDSVKVKLIRRDNIPAAWLQDEITPEHAADDSALVDKMNLTLKDFKQYGFKPNCRLVIMDACYNASFHRDDCIANEYIFQPGLTMVAIGGTVNVLQDKYPDRYLGLMGEGMMAGYLNMYNVDLESHVVGDPTYVFMAEHQGQRLNDNMATGKWQNYKGTQGDENLMADMKSMSIRQHADRIADERLLSVMRNSPDGTERLEAFLQLRERNNESFVTAMLLGANDNYELLQRFAVNAMVKSGDPRLIPAFARILTRPNVSARVAFNATQGIQFFPKDELKKEVEYCIDSISAYVSNLDEYAEDIRKEIKTYGGRWREEIEALCRGELSPKRALLQANFMRIYLAPYLVEKVAAYTLTCEDAKLKHDLLEALGWHRLAYTSKAIADAARTLSNDSTQPAEVRAEALKTLKRIENK